MVDLSEKPGGVQSGGSLSEGTSSVRCNKRRDLSVL